MRGIQERALSLALITAIAMGPAVSRGSEGDVAGDGTQRQIVVTASRIEQPLEDVNASVQVITREQLQTFSGRSVTEVLRQATGTYVKDQGSEAFVSIRGFESDHTLILVDGMRRPDKTESSVLSNLHVGEIERIEIVRGPMSALYGSEALGGVINIITRDSVEKTAYGMSLTGGVAEGGQRDTGIANAYANWSGERSSHRLSVEKRKRDDFRVHEDSITTDLRAEDREYLTYNGRFSLNATDSVGWMLDYADQDDEGVGLDINDEPYARVEQERRYFVSGKYEGVVAEGILTTTMGYGVADAISDKGYGEQPTDSSQRQLDTLYTFSPHRHHTISAGLGHRWEDLESSILSAAAERTVNDLLLQDQWRIAAGLELVTGVRYDDYDDYGDAVSPRATLVWRPGRWTARAGYGEGFKAPTLVQLYSDYARGNNYIVGNPELEAETSRTTEVAMGYRFERARMEMVAHYSEIVDMIQLVDTGNRVGSLRERIYRNVDEATIKGVEWTVDAQVTQIWRVDGSLEYLDARDEQTGEKLEDRADWTARIGSTTVLGRTKLHVRVSYLRDYWKDDESTDFASADIRVDYRWSKVSTVFAGIDNLLDAELPENMLWGTSPTDPGARYYYTGVRLEFR